MKYKTFINPLVVFALLTGMSQLHAQDLRSLQAACNSDDAESCMNLAFKYEGGMPDENAELALESYERACKLGNGEGCVGAASELTPLRAMLAPGTRAIALYEQGCELGATPGCVNAGIVHEYGRGTPVDTALALGLYQRGCSMANRFLCQSAGRLEEVLRGRPSSRGAEAIPMTLFGVTLGKTTIEQLEALHRVRVQSELGCSGGPHYSIKGSTLDPSLEGTVGFYFSKAGVLVGLTTKIERERIDEVSADFDKRYMRVPTEDARSVGADPLWVHGDSEVIIYVPFSSRATIGYYDWGFRGGCISMQLN
ncbi:MAG: tetratricopeptide repeat protein [Granulosicoccus sp.]